jgi:hypothetical protein
MCPNRMIPLLAAVAITLMFISCSTGPSAPQKGTPAFYWSASRETFSAADYVAALDNLGKLLRTDNEFAPRALPWSLVLSSGMAKGYMEVADSFEHGARARKADPTAFRKSMTDQRRLAAEVAMQFLETFQKFTKSNKDQNIALDFPFPSGSAAPVPEFFKIGAGIPVQPADIENAQNRSLQRCVLMATCRAVGAPDDTAKAQEIFKAGGVQAPRNVFVLAMAKSIYELSDLYAPMKIDKPDRQKLFCSQALEALQTLPETKETKALNSKIQAVLKKKT